MMTCALLFAGARGLVGLGAERMLNLLLRAFAITLGLTGPAMAQERILISSDWGKVTAELVDNDATRALVRMLPLTIEMRDHLRQEKTGNLPSPLPAVERQLDFSTGTLGLWSSNHFVIYYRDGRAPSPGLSCSAESPTTSRFSIGPVRSPSALNASDETLPAA